MIAFEDMSVMSRAASLAMYELLGDADLINKELQRYQDVTAAQLREECRRSSLTRKKFSNTLYYYVKN